MKIIEPKVEIITPINGDEILKHIEKVGRVCYKSESKIDDDSAEKFVSGIIKRGHCFDEDTEILTLDGWKHYYELNDNDLYATLNSNNQVEYLPKKEYIEYDYSGDMVKVECRNVNLFVTSEHNMYVCKTTTKSGRKKQNYELAKACDLIEKSHAYIKNSDDVSFNGCNIPLNILKLLGFAIGDGNIYKNKLSFHLKKKRKINYLLSLCNDIGINLLETNQDKTDKKFHISLSTDKRILPYISYFYEIYTTEKEKNIPKKLLKSMNKIESQALLDGLLQSDGSYDRNGSIYYCTTSNTLKNQFQQLALHAGYSSDISNAEYKSGFGSNKPVYRLFLIKGNNKPEISKSKKIGNINIVSNWTGKVWCINLPPYNNVYVRREGKCVWCGNCSVIEHFNITVKFTTDRGITHEIVRHRIASYAQESTRYCNYNKDKFGKEISVIKPINIKEGTKEYEDWLRAMNEAEKSYFTLIEDGCKPQVARSVLPTCTKTEIMVTMNLREWRHFIKLRSSNAAHPDIRILVIDLLKQFKEKIPVIFDDIEVEK